MTFYVIGNGFDRHYGLETGYNHFKDFLYRNGYRELIAKVDDLFYERGDYSPEAIEDWFEFEDMLRTFNCLYADDLYDEAMANAETDDDRAGFWDSPSWNVGFYNDYIEVLKKQFDIWIREFNTRICPDHYFSPKPGDYVLTFNYTTTIEDNFDIRGCPITHIHGTINQEIILGHNDYQEPDSLPVIEDEDSDYRDVTTKKAVNRVLELAANQYFKNSEEILRRYNHVFRMIPRFDKVVIMGLSCGDQDALYVQEIVNRARKIDFYYHGSTARKNFEAYIDGQCIDVKFIEW